MPKKQPKKIINDFKHLFKYLNEFEISLLLKLTNVTGSIILSYTLFKSYFRADYIFKCYILDEKWHSNKWGLLSEVKVKHKIEKVLIAIKHFRIFKNTRAPAINYFGIPSLLQPIVFDSKMCLRSSAICHEIVGVRFRMFLP